MRVSFCIGHRSFREPAIIESTAMLQVGGLAVGLTVICVLSGAKAVEQKVIENSLPAVTSCDIVTSTLLPVRAPTPGVYILGLNVGVPKESDIPIVKGISI